MFVIVPVILEVLVIQEVLQDLEAQSDLVHQPNLEGHSTLVVPVHLRYHVHP